MRANRPPPPETDTPDPARASGRAPSAAVTDATHYVLGGAHVGTAVAERLVATDRRVAIVDETYEANGIPGIAGDPADVAVLSAAGLDGASTAVVATRSDRRTLLVAQLVRTRFDTTRIVALVEDPDRLPLFEDAGHEPFCVTTALAGALDEAV